MSRTFVIADPHFGDPNIIKFENRPFSSVEEMDQTLIDNWNYRVEEPDDTVYVLGDFSFYEDTEKTQDILSQLNGRKILIKGNHDTLQTPIYFNMGFDLVYENPVIINDWFILSHEPLYINHTSPYCNIFGHVHGNPAYNTYSARSACVSVERHEYQPIDISYVIENIANLNRRKR